MQISEALEVQGEVSVAVSDVSEVSLPPVSAVSWAPVSPPRMVKGMASVPPKVL